MSELTTIDKRLLRYAAYKSPEEISELLNGVVSPVEVASRVMELLRSRDWLSTLQRKQLLMERVWTLMDTYEDYAFQGSIKSAELVLKAVRELRTMLADDKNALETSMFLINESHAEKMGQAVALSFEKLLSELTARDVGISRDDASEILEAVLAPALKEIDNNTDKN